VSRDGVLAAHRIPPQLLGIVPSNTGGFGAVLPAGLIADAWPQLVKRIVAVEP
jgi:capsid portal protein